MSFEVDTSLVNSYRSNIEIQFQQKGSRLIETVTTESQNSEFDFFDRIGGVDAVKVKNRHSDTPLISTPHDRRRNATEDYDWADLIDRRDKLRMLADPTSSYTTNAVFALGREKDREILRAAVGTAFSGKTGQNSIAFPATQDVAVDFQEGGSGSASNLTLGKLREIRKKLDMEEAVADGEVIYGVVTAEQIQALLRDPTLTSADFNSIKALVNGEVDQFLGIKFIRILHTLLPKTGDVRDCVFYTKSAIHMGMADDVMVDVGPRRDKRNSVQVYVSASFGATRMWEEKVIRCKCDETK